MLNSEVLGVVIGLLFVYLLYSLLATIIQEMVATGFGFRAKVLERSIYRMLQDEPRFHSRVISILSLFWKFKDRIKLNVPIEKAAEPSQKTTSWRLFGSRVYRRPENAFELFYQHPLVKLLSEDNHYSKPGYLYRDSFAKILIDLLRGDNLKPGEDARPLIQSALDKSELQWLKNTAKLDPVMHSYICSIWADAQGDINKFKVLLENWFDETMDRASGWYKRYTQFILLFIGLIIAITFNVNTFDIISKLEKDPVLRQQLVQQADNFLRAHPNLEAEPATIPTNAETRNIDTATFQRQQDSLQARYDTLQARADALIKGDIAKVRDVLATGSPGQAWNKCQTDKHPAYCRFKLILGWLLTALALSLGAPFWFDLLNKIMKLRNAVVADSGEKTKTPAELQKPMLERKG